MSKALKTLLIGFSVLVLLGAGGFAYYIFNIKSQLKTTAPKSEVKKGTEVKKSIVQPASNGTVRTETPVPAGVPAPSPSPAPPPAPPSN